ncbi:MAG: Stk1 family PASTA domain-containing Ser/Thr kinase [Erysipelothrix sp.]|nr:Stk1 family PASTA domain-containing Ser/Thr kinase [Erysipelothrix sp.]
MNKGDILAKRYKIVKIIGQGGMADVYLAYDILLERDVAIKILRNEIASDAVSLLRFKHEAVAVSKLSHPNIIEIFDIGEHDSRQYIVMEYVDGKTLKQLVSDRGGLYQEEAIYIMRQLTSAISEAHNNEIIHRDIKPQNVLVKSDGSVIITDFGIALAQNALHLTQKETVMGSVHYLAPELARGEKATYQSDIYALGIVFYELLAGSVPFSGETAIQIAMQHINKPIPSIREFNPTIAQTVENVIIKATFKNKQQRYKSALEMLRELESVFDEDKKDVKKLATDPLLVSDDKTKVISKLQTVEETQKNPKRNKMRKRNVIIASVLAVVLLFGAIYISMLPKQIEEVVVPDVVGLSLDDARNRLLDYGLIIGTIDRDLDDELDVNNVIKQTPRSNSQVEKGSQINIVVSLGKYFVFGDYVGRDYDVVRYELENALKIVIRTEYSTIPNVAAGEIFSQSIVAGSKLNPNNTVEVKFVVAKEQEITIPSNLYGMDIYQAQKILEDLGAKVILEPITEGSPEFLAAQEKNKVHSTLPARNSIYVQTENSSVIIKYYEDTGPVVPDPEPDPEPEPGDGA